MPNEWKKEQSEAKQNICTGWQDPKKAETPPSLSSEKSQPEPGTSSRQETEFTSQGLTGLMGICSANSLGMARPARPKHISHFSTRS